MLSYEKSTLFELFFPMGMCHLIKLINLNKQSFSTKLFFLKIIYLFMRDTQKEREGQRHRQREKQAPCREPDVRLDPRSPGSLPGPKAGAQPLSHPGVPNTSGFSYAFVFIHMQIQFFCCCNHSMDTILYCFPAFCYIVFKHTEKLRVSL